MSLYKLPSFSVTGLVISTSPGSINASASLAGSLPTGVTRNLHLFVGKSPSVSPDPASYLYQQTASISSTYTSGSVSLTTITTASLSALGIGITSGQTVYIVAYAEGYSSNSYVDLATGRNYYSNLNPTPSNIVTVVVP